MAHLSPASDTAAQSGSIPAAQFEEVIAEFLRVGKLEESLTFGEPHLLLAIPNDADSKHRASYISPHGIKFFNDGKQIYHEIVMSELQPAVAERVAPLLDTNMDFFKIFNFKLSLDRRRIMPKVLGYYVWKAQRDESADEDLTPLDVDQLNQQFPLLGLRLMTQSLPESSVPENYVASVILSFASDAGFASPKQ